MLLSAKDMFDVDPRPGEAADGLLGQVAEALPQIADRMLPLLERHMGRELNRSLLHEWLTLLCEASDDTALQPAPKQLALSRDVVQWAILYLYSRLDAHLVEKGGAHVHRLRATCARVLVRRLAWAAEQPHSESKEPAPPSAASASWRHELCNLLNAARLHTVFLRRLVANHDEAIEAVDAVNECITRTAELLHRRRSDGVGRRLVDLRMFCARAVQHVFREAYAEGISLGTSGELPTVDLELDMSKLELVLVDLLESAVREVLEDGSGRVMLRARRETCHAVIEVQDQAKAIKMRDSSSTSSKPTYNIVHREDGWLEVLTRPGDTVFRIALPVTRGQSVDVA